MTRGVPAISRVIRFLQSEVSRVVPTAAAPAVTAATRRAATARRNAGGGKTRREVRVAGGLRKNTETAGPGETETGRSPRETGGGGGGGVRRSRNLGDVMTTTIVGSDTSRTAQRMSDDPEREIGESAKRLR